MSTSAAVTVILRRCDHCKLAFHKPAGEGVDGCLCRHPDCGCRLKHEEEETA